MKALIFGLFAVSLLAANIAKADCTAATGSGANPAGIFDLPKPAPTIASGTTSTGTQN